MRTRLVTVPLAATSALLLAGSLGPAAAGPPIPNSVLVSKFVQGQAPAGVVFEVVVTCTPVNPATQPAIPPVTIRFDASGSPLDPNMLSVDSGYQCTATETVSNGASVRYGCDMRLFPDDSSPPPGNDPDIPAQCIDDQTLIFRDARSSGSVADLGVINTFEEEAAPQVVAARPGFTG